VFRNLAAKAPPQVLPAAAHMPHFLPIQPHQWQE